MALEGQEALARERAFLKPPTTQPPTAVRATAAAPKTSHMAGEARGLCLYRAVAPEGVPATHPRHTNSQFCSLRPESQPLFPRPRQPDKGAEAGAQARGHASTSQAGPVLHTSRGQSIHSTR